MKLLLRLSYLALFGLFANIAVATENTPPPKPKSESPKAPPMPKTASPKGKPLNVLKAEQDIASARKNKQRNTDAETSGDPRLKGE